MSEKEFGDKFVLSINVMVFIELVLSEECSREPS